MAEKRNHSNDGLPHDGSVDGLSSLQALVQRAGNKKRGPAPVEKWEPDYCGELDMEIRRDGTWFYMGTPIGRKRLVELFSTVLRKDADGETYLVTPVEKIKIRVEDAPFVAVEMDARNEAGEPVLTFRTNCGDVVEASKDHPIRFEFEIDSDGVKPYVHVRGRLEALLARPVMYELIAQGRETEIAGTRMFSVRSHGAEFPIMSADKLAAQSARK